MKRISVIFAVIALVTFGTSSNLVSAGPYAAPGIPFPEAGTLILVVSGLAGLVGYRRKRRME